MWAPQISWQRRTCVWNPDRLGGWILRRTFGRLVVKTAPRAEEIEQIARDAGWNLRTRRDDGEQPVYVMELA